MRRVAVTAERSGRWWVLEAPEAGAVSQCRRLSEVDSEMREAIAYQLKLAPDAFDIDVEVIPTTAYLQDVAAAEELQAQAVTAALQAAAARACVAKGLAERDGLSVRDIGRVMGISFQRAQQLSATASHVVS